MNVQFYLEDKLMMESQLLEANAQQAGEAFKQSVTSTDGRSPSVKKGLKVYQGAINDMKDGGVFESTIKHVKELWPGSIFKGIYTIVTNFGSIVKMGLQDLGSFVAIKVSHYFVELCKVIVNNKTIKDNLRFIHDFLNKLLKIFETPNPAKVVGLAIFLLGAMTIVVFAFIGYAEQMAELNSKEGGFKFLNLIKGLSGVVTKYPFMTIVGVAMMVGGAMAIVQGNKWKWSKEYKWLRSDGSPATPPQLTK